MIDLTAIKKRLQEATPGPYDARVKEFSNTALPEVWTEYGWLKELPRDYRVPTVEFLAHAPTDIACLIEALEKCKDTFDFAMMCSGSKYEDAIKITIKNALKEIFGEAE